MENKTSNTTLTQGHLSASASEEEKRIRASLRHCSDICIQDVLRYRRTGDTWDLRCALAGLLTTFTDASAREKILRSSEALSLAGDLGIDSLSLMEFSLMAEDAFDLRIGHEEISGITTTEDVFLFFDRALNTAPTPTRASEKPAASKAVHLWAPEGMLRS